MLTDNISNQKHTVYSLSDMENDALLQNIMGSLM